MYAWATNLDFTKEKNEQCKLYWDRTLLTEKKAISNTPDIKYFNKETKNLIDWKSV